MNKVPTAVAVNIIATHIVNKLCDPDAVAELWEDYPDVGILDWEDICSEVAKLAAFMEPDTAVFDAAYKTLWLRATDVPA